MKITIDYSINTIPIMASPFALMQNDHDFLNRVKADDRSDYVLRKVSTFRKTSCTKSLECTIENLDNIDLDLLKQKKHHINNIGLLHITKGPKNPKTIDKITGLTNVRFLHEGNIYYPGDE